MDSRNVTFMFYGFAIAWLIVMVYVITLVRRTRRLKESLDQVERLGDSPRG